MDKFQVYLTKQNNKQKKAFHKIRNRMGNWQSSNHLMTNYEKSRQKAKNSSTHLLLRDEFSGSKTKHNNSMDGSKLKSINMNEKKRTKSYYERYHTEKKLQLSYIDKERNKKLLKPNSFSSIMKKYNNSYSANKRYNKSEIEFNMKKGIENNMSLNPGAKKVNIGKQQENLQDAKANKKRSKSATKIQVVEEPKPSKITFESMFRTRKGVQIMNPNKVNQDRVLIEENMQIKQNQYELYAVADGHGAFGHLVSHSIVSNLKFRLATHIESNKANSIKKCYEKTFNDLQSIIEKTPDLNAECSGSTLVSVLIENHKKVTCANVGDSRAIIARQSKYYHMSVSKQNWEVIRLSDDHKPSLEKEKRRILKCGGRIQKIKDQDGNGIGPFRVWLPKKQLQGLAMSRSFGDNISKPYGVIHEPQILTHMLDRLDKFMLIASDGVWQFLSNYQILNILIPYYRQGRLQEACEALLKAAYESWTVQDNSIVDDISFVLIFFGEN